MNVTFPIFFDAEYRVVTIRSIYNQSEYVVLTIVIGNLSFYLEYLRSLVSEDRNLKDFDNAKVRFRDRLVRIEPIPSTSQYLFH